MSPTLTKAAHVAPQEQQPASVQVPEALYPARVKLSTKLAELERIVVGLEEYRSRSERPSIAENRALEDSDLSEEDAAAAIGTAQIERGVYQSRIRNREKMLALIAGELTSAIKEAAGELRALISREVTRREEILTKRVSEAIGAIDRPGLKPTIQNLLDHSRTIEQVRILVPSPLMVPDGDHASLAMAATDVLTEYAHVISEAGKKI